MSRVQKIWHMPFAALLVLVLLGGAQAADTAKAVPALRADLVLNGDAKCTKCHDANDSPGVLAIGRTKHGVRADGRTPGCTSCHGESQTHLASKGDAAVDVVFKKGIYPPSAVSVTNQSCLSCHRKDATQHLWTGSAHDSNDVACTACHQVHVTHDKVLDKRTQPEVCYTCHKAQRAQFNKQSHHPTPEGKVACSDCHNAHGSVGPKLAKKDSVVETCYSCHMEKRGPFVHNHQPVNDDCTHCHTAHGSTADSLLKARSPQVCNQCHSEPSSHGTPGIAGIAPPVTRFPKANTFIEQGRGCLNCHTEIHGSNNPHGGQNLLSPTLFFR
jgi:DmsE family decaheme c-type cytochrome